MISCADTQQSGWCAVDGPQMPANYSLDPIALPLEHGKVMFQVNEDLMQLPFDLISKCVKTVNSTHQHAADEVVKIIQGNQYLSGFIYPHFHFFKISWSLCLYKVQYT